MSGIDTLIVAVSVGAILYGLYKGVIAQIGTLGGIVAGIAACRLVAARFTPIVAGLTKWDADNPIGGYIDSIIANLIIFALTFVIVKLLSQMVRAIACTLSLGMLDRLAGMLVTLFSWLLALSLLLNAWQAIKIHDNLSEKGKLLDGRLAKCVIDLGPKILGSDSPAQLFDEQ